MPLQDVCSRGTFGGSSRFHFGVEGRLGRAPVDARCMTGTSRRTSNVWRYVCGWDKPVEGWRLPTLLRPRGADRGLHMLALFGRGQHGPQPERLEPELPAPALGVIEVLVFLVFDLLVGALQCLGLWSGQVLGAFADELPIQMFFGLRENHAFARNNLRRGRVARRRSLFHGLHQGPADG